jgi:hypothetical protein
MMQNRNPLNLTKHERIFVIVAAILGFVLDNGSSKFLGFIMPFGRDMAVTWGILRVIGNIMVSAVFAFILFRMIKLFRESGFTLKRTLLTVASAVFVLSLIGLNILRYAAVRDFNQYLESWNTDINQRIVSKMSQALPIEKKSKLSFLYAKGVFIDDGRLIEYLAPDGTSIAFSPSAEDQSNRNMIVFQRTQGASEKLIDTINCLSLLISLLGACSFSFTAKIQRTREVN